MLQLFLSGEVEKKPWLVWQPWLLAGAAAPSPWALLVVTDVFVLAPASVEHLVSDMRKAEDKAKEVAAEAPAEPSPSSAVPVPPVREPQVAAEPSFSSVPPAREREPVEYIRKEQRSPNRKRGRAPVLGRTSLKTRTSLDDILSSSPVEAAKLLMDAGFLLRDPSQTGTCKCEDGGRWKLEEQSLSCQWRCKSCRKTVAVTRREDELFSGTRLALRSLAGALWVYTSNFCHQTRQVSSWVLTLAFSGRCLRSSTSCSRP